MVLGFNDILPLAVIYIIAFALGLVISKFWLWFRIIAFIFLFQVYFRRFDFPVLSLPFVLVLAVPAGLLLYPSLIRMFVSDFGWRHPFDQLAGQIRGGGRRPADRKEREEAERILRMQAELAERQRRFEREKAEWEAGRKTGEKPRADLKKDPYEVLGVGRSASLEEARKAYAELSKKYHPDRVSHLGAEFQEMAHERYLEIMNAWSKIQRDKKS